MRLVLIALVAACGSKGRYECASAAQCVQEGVSGICSAGYCAFPDPACDGGYRFESNAGDGLANTCTTSTIDAGVDAPPATLCIADVGFGRRFGCVLKMGGTIWCSGANANGQLGFGLAGVTTPTPMQVRDVSTNVITDAIGLGLGRQHACAIRTGGTVWCWGANESGQLGNNSSVESAAAVQVVKTDDTPLANAAAVALGYNHSCARLESGEVYCWGANTQNELGDGTTTTRTRAAPVLVEPAGAAFTGAVELGVGAGHGCVRKANDELWCWGKNNDGEIGDNTNAHKPNPVRTGDATAFATSLWGSCRVNADTTIACHGWNRGAMFSLNKEEGYNQAANYLVPTQAVTASGAPVMGASKVAMGSGLCAIMTDGSVQCAGDGQYGQNGTGMSKRVLAPVLRRDGSPLTGVDRLVAKWPHVCAHETTGSWVCWGRGSEGEFGDGTFDNRGYATPLTASCP